MPNKLRMGAIIALLALALITALPSIGGAETLIWTASTGTVDGYKVYYGTSQGDLSAYADAGDRTEYDLDRLPLVENRTYYLCISAFNQVGESPPCAPVVFTPGDNTPPAPPGGLVAE